MPTGRSTHLAQTSERRDLDLAHPFARNTEALGDLAKGLLGLPAQPVAPRQHGLVARLEPQQETPQAPDLPILDERLHRQQS